VLHLGCGIGGARGSLFDYKRGFSDRTHPFFTWRVVTDPVEYERLTRARTGRAADDDDGFFPAYRRAGR
jgi:hypothetical protein